MFSFFDDVDEIRHALRTALTHRTYYGLSNDVQWKIETKLGPRFSSNTTKEQLIADKARAP